MFAAAVLNLRYIGIMATMPLHFKQGVMVTRLLGIHLTADENWAQTLTARQSDAKVGVFLSCRGWRHVACVLDRRDLFGQFAWCGFARLVQRSGQLYIHGRFYWDVNRHGAVALGTSLVQACQTIVPIL